MMRYKDTRTGSCKGLIGNLDSRYCQSSRFLPHDAMGLHHQLTLQFNLHAPLLSRAWNVIEDKFRIYVCFYVSN
jgi:hypothetical protein